jgi:hypothetical protein
VSHCWTAFPQHQPGNNCNQKETDNLKSGGGDPNGNARLAKKNGKSLTFFPRFRQTGGLSRSAKFNLQLR